MKNNGLLKRKKEMETVSKVLVLGLDKAFEITDDKTGEIIPGRKLYYAVPRGEMKRSARTISKRSMFYA